MDPSRLPGYFYNCCFILGIISLQSSYHCNSLRMCFCILNFPSACGDQLYLLFLAVQNSSTGDLVTQSVSHSLVTCETFDQSYEKTWSDLPTYLTTCLSNYLPTYLPEVDVVDVCKYWSREGLCIGLPANIYWCISAGLPRDEAIVRSGYGSCANYADIPSFFSSHSFHSAGILTAVLILISTPAWK